MYSQYIVLPEGLSFSKVFSVKPEPITSLWYFLHTIPDARRAQGRRHNLPTVLLLALLALCSGHHSYQAMEEWAENYQDLLKKQLPFIAGHIPDAATFYRVFSHLDVEAFEKVLGNWLQKIIPSEKGEGIAIDGKTISGTGVHLVSAFTHKIQSVLFEIGTDIKGKELIFGPQVLENIPVKDHIITGDAMFAQKKICEQIVRRDGGYVFTVKGNQEKLEEDIRLFFNNKPFGIQFPENMTITRWKGRVEKRRIRISDNRQLLSYLSWPGLTHVWEVTREIKRKGITTIEIAVGIASLPKKYATAQKLNEYIRGHWSIENSLHRQRDKVFNEDKATIRKGHAPQIMAALRNLVLSIFHRATVRNFNTAFRRFAAKPEELFSFLGLNHIAKSYVYA
jgi:predicted transposase YbfD/YdcC